VIDFAGGGIFLSLAQPFASRLLGPYAQALGQYGGPAITALTGWGLSKLLEMFGFTRRFAKPARILGYSTAVIQIVQPLVARALGPVVGGQGMGWRRQGMRGIAAVHGIPPQIMPPPMPQQQQSMGGMATVPGIWNR